MEPTNRRHPIVLASGFARAVYECSSPSWGASFVSVVAVTHMGWLRLVGSLKFCRISSLLQGSFAKETYNFKEPTNQSK